MGKSEYAKKYRDPRWQKKRLEIFDRDHWSCTNCGADDTELHVHHAYYLRHRDPWDYPNLALSTLCDGCHEERHRIADERKSWRDDAPGEIEPIDMIMAIFDDWVTIGEAEQAALEFGRINYRMREKGWSRSLRRMLLWHVANTLNFDSLLDDYFETLDEYGSASFKAERYAWRKGRE